MWLAGSCSAASSGNQPLADGAVVLATGSAAEALKAAEPLCAQLLWREGRINMTSALGPRWSNITDVAFNRTIAVGASIKKVGVPGQHETVLTLGSADTIRHRTDDAFATQ
jgi:hypothetical protein